MAYSAYLKLDGIEGDVKTAGHVREISVLGYSFGTDRGPSIGHAGGGGGTGKVIFNDLGISKKLDCATQKLFTACATGEKIATGKLSVEKPAGGPIVSYDLTDIIVSHVSSDGGDDPVESVTLNFGTVAVKYTKEQ